MLISLLHGINSISACLLLSFFYSFYMSYFLYFLVFIGPSVSRFHSCGACITLHNVSRGGMLSGHMFPPLVSLHLTVPLLVDLCAMWMRKKQPLFFFFCFFFYCVVVVFLHSIALSSECTVTRGLIVYM